MSSSWHIYGREYDLSTFIDKHPGGKEILEYTKGQPDITSLFESYHGFSDKKSIKESLDQYEIKQAEIVTYDKYDYTEYNELIEIIKNKTALKARSDIKAPPLFYMQTTIVSILYAIMFPIAISGYFNVYISSALSFFSGLLWMSIIYCLMHDSSHYAISMDPSVNNVISRITHSFGLWNHTIWFFHHVYYHHSFTNLSDDTDIYHYYPFAIKAINSKKLIFGKYVTYLLPLAMLFLPGFYFGQSIVYFTGYLMKEMLNKKLPKGLTYFHLYELALYVFKAAILLKSNLYVSFAYIISLNLWYNINVVGDHDTYETHIENHYSGKSFLRIQVCNSGNFFTNSWWWHHFFGGINYQIEHHLFPNMSHKHYRMISPIVKEYCKERNIPYVEHQNIVQLYKSFLKTIDYYSN
jgi:fatty acid desaturase